MKRKPLERNSFHATAPNSSRVMAPNNFPGPGRSKLNVPARNTFRASRSSNRDSTIPARPMIHKEIGGTGNSPRFRRTLANRALRSPVRNDNTDFHCLPPDSRNIAGNRQSYGGRYSHCQTGVSARARWAGMPMNPAPQRRFAPNPRPDGRCMYKRVCESRTVSAGLSRMAR